MRSVRDGSSIRSKHKVGIFPMNSGVEFIVVDMASAPEVARRR
jgi:hypothetical protein